MTNTEIRHYLQQHANDRLSSFSLNLQASASPIMGVPVPALRALAKTIAKENWEEYLSDACDETFEERLLQGLVIGYAKMPLKQRFSYLDQFIPLIDGWGTCDYACATYTFARKEHHETWEYLMQHLHGNTPMAQRFAIVMLLDHYINPAYIPAVLAELQQVDSDVYLVQMAAGWALSVCYVKFPQLTAPLLANRELLSQPIRSKAIRKCIESLRVSESDKQWLRSIRN